MAPGGEALMRDKLRIIVFGMIGRCPFGGQTWLSLNWLRGLQILGHDVWYVEDDAAWPFDPVRCTVTDDCLYAVAHIRCCAAHIGMVDRWAFRFGGRGGQSWGLPGTDLDELYRSCDVLLNFGTADLREEHRVAPLRVYIESDPVMSQLRLARGDEHTRQAFENHSIIFTYGENYGSQDCGVPLSGFIYKKTRQPIALEWWPFSFEPTAKYFTTIGNYRQDGNDIEYQGRIYRWSKHYEWEKFMDLPRRTNQPFEVALIVNDPEDRRRLCGYGWEIISPYEMSLDVFGAYPGYIRGSRAEFTVAKDQNVRLRSGWFSERDACYLASGKPVVAQDTGFTNILPAGEGLFGSLGSIGTSAGRMNANSTWGTAMPYARSSIASYASFRTFWSECRPTSIRIATPIARLCPCSRNWWPRWEFPCAETEKWPI
jgi:hypothetical protein